MPLFTFENVILRYEYAQDLLGEKTEFWGQDILTSGTGINLGTNMPTLNITSDTPGYA